MVLDVLHQLRAKIATGELPLGGRLPPERALAEQFGVSRTALREATVALSQLGVLDIRHGVGTFVAPDASRLIRAPLEWLILLQPKDIAGIYEVRRFIETQTVAAATERRTPEGIARLEASIEQMRASRRASFREINACDVQFHADIAAMSQNVPLRLLYGPLLEVFWHLYRQVLLTSMGLESSEIAREDVLSAIEHQDVAGAIEGHQRIVDALKSGDPEAARAAMEAHLNQSEARLTARISVANRGADGKRPATRPKTPRPSKGRG